MRSRIQFIANRAERNLAASGSSLLVFWENQNAGVFDEPTQSFVGGVNTILSGEMKAFVIEQPARDVVRQFTEIQAGDLICDIAPQPNITIYEGQIFSGTRTLDSIKDQSVKFGWQGRRYEQKETGGRLALIWDAVFADVPLHRTMLLRLEP